MTKEEAIKELRGFIGQLTEGCQEAIKVLIPELKESNDERIRKDLIKYLESDRDCQPCQDVSFYDSSIAWLEKQKAKEQLDRMAPIYNDKESFESALEKAWEYYNKSASRTVDSFEDDYIECVFSKGFREGFLYKEKQKEPKPSEWSKNDTVFLNEITDFFENRTTKLQHDLEMYAHWLKSLPKRFNLEPKNKWSEEDKFKLEDAITGIDVGIGFYETEGKHPNLLKAIIEAKEWLKSLRPQPKPEWSEEDEEMRNTIIQVLKSFVSQAECESNPSISTSYPTYWKEIDWLESLSPQSKVEWSEKNMPKWKKVTDYTKLPTDAIVRYESDKNLQIENAISEQDVSRILGFKKPIAYYLTPDDLNKLPKEEK